MADVLDQEPELDDVPGTALELRRPDIPITIGQLAALKGEALEIIEARVRVLETLRKAALRATNPEDWVLFKARDDQGGQIVAYLQDVGCERVRDLYGIEVFDVGTPQKVLGQQPGEFYYLIKGAGRCKFTLQVIESLEGGRSSLDDVCKGKAGVALDLAVRKNARANLDGNVVRELAGLGSVPLDEIKAAWVGTNKRAEHCRLGRGFGSGVERQGQRATQEGETREAPKCGVCGASAVFRPAGVTTTGKKYEAFWTCPESKKHQDKKWTLDDSKWREQLEGRTKATETPAATANGSTPAPASSAASALPLTANDIPFGGGRDREPGEDG